MSKRKQVRIKASFLMDKDDHICVLRENASECIKEFSFLTYEQDIIEILEKEDSKYGLYDFLSKSFYFYEFLMYHKIDYIHFHYMKFSHKDKEYTYFYSEENDYDNYWIDTGTYSEKWFNDASNCYQTEFEINDKNDDWKV